eukprot:TRINITY_DN21101_c0_g1_i1.p1 TRINITY_DN21101_c0_g1~~TRINITY_DN21101_c0_g1_i1.p1  ORF type:complete len:134 (+),score=19.48 TRINITY_DN21101_c0_g1_i1:138-539(+)
MSASDGLLGSEPSKGASLQEAGAALLDNMWQFAHIGGAAFLFYEDRVLCACSLIGYLGLALGVAGLMFSGMEPTMGDRLYGTTIPVCGSLAVVTSTASRIMGRYYSTAVLLFIVNLAITVVTVRGDKAAKLRQ